MPLSEIDRLWFATHPDRAHRLREQTPAEIGDGAGLSPDVPRQGWVIIRKEDGAAVEFRAEDGPPNNLSEAMTAYWFEHFRASAR